MRGNQIAAIRRAIDGQFPLGAATDGADFLGLGRAETARFAPFADWTKHQRSPGKVWNTKNITP